MKEKLIINTTLIRKESEFRTKSCVVEKAIAVSNAEFENLKRHPLRDNRLIAENVDMMYCDRDDKYHCLLIYDEEQGDGLLIESEGTSYARYSQYISRAKELVEKHLQPDIKVEADSVNEDLSEETEMNMTM
ncbi:MAG: hypothetical protein IJY19_02350 [Ruminococcus sp.]|nr:hypothetical protein [Ruminococcus sp.]